MKDVQAVRGADTDFDYNLLVGTMCMKWKKIMRFQKRKQKMGSAEVTFSIESARYSRRKIR
jgi:hypothetical protein